MPQTHDEQVKNRWGQLNKQGWKNQSTDKEQMGTIKQAGVEKINRANQDVEKVTLVDTFPINK